MTTEYLPNGYKVLAAEGVGPFRVILAKRPDENYRCEACNDPLYTEDGEVFFSGADGGNICPALSNMERETYEPHDPRESGNSAQFATWIENRYDKPFTFSGVYFESPHMYESVGDAYDAAIADYTARLKAEKARNLR